MASAVRVGDPAPDFGLPGWYAGEVAQFTLSAERGHPVVLAFYPGDGDPVSESQLIAYSDELAQLTADGAVVWAISPQDLASKAAFAGRFGLKLPLLADVDGRVAQAYGVLAQPGPAQPGPAQPGPAQPGPAQPGPAQPGPAQPGPAQPGPAQPGPAQPGPAQPGPAQPGPAGPALVRPGPAAGPVAFTRAVFVVDGGGTVGWSHRGTRGLRFRSPGELVAVLATVAGPTRRGPGAT